MEIAGGGECIDATMAGFWMSVAAAQWAGLIVASEEEGFCNASAWEGFWCASGGEGFAKAAGMPQKWTAEGVASGAEDFEFVLLQEMQASGEVPRQRRACSVPPLRRRAL